MYTFITHFRRIYIQHNPDIIHKSSIRVEYNESAIITLNIDNDVFILLIK